MESGVIMLLAAGKSTRFPGMRPKWLLTDPQGELMAVRAVKSIRHWTRQRLIVAITREHVEQYDAEMALDRGFNGAAELVVLDQSTSGPAQTAYEVIRQMDLDGPVFLKDCDSWFAEIDYCTDNYICCVDLRQSGPYRDVPLKSFVHLNADGLVSGIIEKSVSSNFISVGGYGFSSAEAYATWYDHISHKGSEAVYVSHVINQGLVKGAAFRGHIVDRYVDAGTLRSWQEFRRNSTVFLIDIDGVVTMNQGRFVPPYWDEPDVIIERNVESLLQLQAAGAQFVFVTSRPEEFREKTEKALKIAGLRWHSIVFGLNHAPRVLVNDYSSSNPYPSAQAINLPRNSPTLSELLG